MPAGEIGANLARCGVVVFYIPAIDWLLFFSFLAYFSCGGQPSWWRCSRIVCWRIRWRRRRQVSSAPRAWWRHRRRRWAAATTANRSTRRGSRVAAAPGCSITPWRSIIRTTEAAVLVRHTRYQRRQPRRLHLPPWNGIIGISNGTNKPTIRWLLHLAKVIKFDRPKRQMFDNFVFFPSSAPRIINPKRMDITARDLIRVWMLVSYICTEDDEE